MSWLLAIETSSDACSVALSDGAEVIEQHVEEPRRHAELVLQQVRAVLAEAGISVTQLAALVYGRGPGSFTGVRIATAVVQGLAYGAELGVVPVSSLATLALSGALADSTKIAVAIDAHMSEVYFGAYELRRKVASDGERAATTDIVEVGSEVVSAPEAVALPVDETDGSGWTLVGSGWNRYAEQFICVSPERAAAISADIHPRAANALQLGRSAWLRGEIVAPEHAIPTYLRNRVTR